MRSSIAVSSTRCPGPRRVRFRIGVSGHRGPPKFPMQSVPPVRAVLDRIFKVTVERGRAAETADCACAPAREACAGAARANMPLPGNPARSGADFVVVSSLAEGADRLVAEAGLKAGFTLEAVLPFSRAEYSRDFETQQSQAAYEELLDRASAVLELKGQRDDSPRAYQAAGFIMLANASLLIAIWDGEQASGIGGTAEIISRAVAEAVPVIWIEPANPNALRLSWSPRADAPAGASYSHPTATFRPVDETELAGLMDEILALPRQPKRSECAEAIFATKERR